MSDDVDGLIETSDGFFILTDGLLDVIVCKFKCTLLLMGLCYVDACLNEAFVVIDFTVNGECFGIECYGSVV